MTAERQEDERLGFLERRASGIGATDSPKILGLSRYGSSLSVYNDKVLREEHGVQSLPAWLGNKLQATVGELYTSATGQALRADNRHHRHRTHDWMVCHLDYRAKGRPDLLIECKTRAYMAGWGEDGSAEIPVDVWVQVQHEMAVTDASEAHVAVLFGHHTFRVYVIKRDDVFIAKLIEKLESWWVMHYLARVPPLPSGADVDTDQMKRDFPDNDDTLKAATPEQSEVAMKLRQATINEKQAALAAEELRNRIRLFIGDAAGITGPFGSITWKRSKDRVSTDWEQVAVTRGNIIDDLLDWANPGDDPELVGRLAHAQTVAATVEDLFTTTAPGSRRFITTFREETPSE